MNRDSVLTQLVTAAVATSQRPLVAELAAARAWLGAVRGQRRAPTLTRRGD